MLTIPISAFKRNNHSRRKRVSSYHCRLHVGKRLKHKMSENTAMIKRTRKSKVYIDEEDTNVPLKNKSLNIKKKEKRNVVKCCGKTNTKQQIKQKGKSVKASKKSSASNLPAKNNRKSYEEQMKKLEEMFKNSPNSVKLTPDELKVLCMKFKTDGHYRVNKNLPPIETLLNSTHNTVEENEQSASTSNTEEINFKSSTNVMANQYWNSNVENQCLKEDLNIYECAPSTSKCWLSKPTEISNTNAMDNRMEDKHLYVNQNLLNGNNCYHTLTHPNMQTANNTNVFDGIQNLSELKPDFGIMKISDKENYPPYNFVNSQSKTKERPYYGYGNTNLVHNIFDQNTQYEHFSNNSEIVQQNEAYCTVPYNNNVPVNPDFYNEVYTNNRNDNQFYRNAPSMYIPWANNLQPYYSIKNSMTSSQVTLIQNHFENESNFNSFVRTNMYPMMNIQKDVIHVSNNIINTEQDPFNPYTASVNILPDAQYPETNTFPLSNNNDFDQYM